jgi:RimJ/RimL family protein N-acetyltransferase
MEGCIVVLYDLKDCKKLEIRKICDRDAFEVVDVWTRMGGETENLTFGREDFYFTPEQQKSFISNILYRENCLYICGLIDGRIVSALSFLTSSNKRLMHRGDLGIGVLKDYWNIGVGNALLDYFFRWAASTGTIKKIDLEVRDDNAAAIALYEKWSFNIEGKIERGMCINGRFYDLYHMGRTIG